MAFSFRSADERAYFYCLANSSFAYWHWRLYDGGITYSRGLIEALPVFYDICSDEDKAFFRRMEEEMTLREKEFIIKKNNVGVQENIKFPREFRDRINKRFLEILGRNENAEVFDILHSNKALEEN